MPGGYYLPSASYEALYGYQRAGVAWLWSIHSGRMGGGILGDDMGLGKTVQVWMGSLFAFASSAVWAVVVHRRRGGGGGGTRTGGVGGDDVL